MILLVLFGAVVIAAGILIIRNRHTLGQSNGRRQQRYLGKMGRNTVEAGMSSPGFVALTGLGFILIGVGQLAIGLFTSPS